MTTSPRDLEDGLRRLAGQVDPEPSRQRLDMTLPALAGEAQPTPAVPRRRRRVVALAAAGAAATVAVVAVLSSSGIIGGADPDTTADPAGNSAAQGAPTPDGAGNPQADGPAGLVEPGEPCPIAAELPTSLPEILARVKVPVWVPLREPITQAWTCGETPVLMFNDVQVSYEAGWDSIEVPAKFELLAADYGGRIEQIGSHSALVQPSPKEGASNQVMIVQGDTLVRLLALDTVPIERLVALAGSLPIPPLR